MRAVLNGVLEWLAAGRKVAIATVIRVDRSGPMPPGSSLAVNDEGVVMGSVSGGCVEPAVVEEANLVLAGGPAKKLTYGISDDQAFEVGLTCGGTIHLIVTAADPDLVSALAPALNEERPIALATVVKGDTLGSSLLVSDDEVKGSLGNNGLDQSVADDALGMLELADTGIRTYGPEGEPRPDDVEVFIQSSTPRPDMYVFGAIDFASAVCRVGSFLGYRVTVCDARAAFATRARFPDADEIVVHWPHEFLAEARVNKRTVMCVLTHDPKFDVPVIKEALATDAAYIGAMGSRRTRDDRRRRLIEAGVEEKLLSRISSPIGLDIGASTPEEVAVAIAGEIIALRHGADGGRLRDQEVTIHKHHAGRTP